MAPKKQDDLMSLPAFDGQRPDNVQNRVFGSVTLDPPVGVAEHVGATGYAVIEYEITNVGHKRTSKDGNMSRCHALKVTRIGGLSLAEGGALLLESHRAAREAAGVSELPGVGDGTGLAAVPDAP